MWFKPPAEPVDWSVVTRHLSRVDPVMKQAIKRVGPCVLAPRRDYFVRLCKSIYGQQISTTVADTLFTRFSEQFPRRRPTPALVHAALTGGWTDEQVRHCGLSRQKRAYVVDLCEHFIDSRIPTRKLMAMSDDEVVEALTRVKGVGRWTAEMFLIFVLNRPDIFPVDDLGLQMAVKNLYGLPTRPTPKQLQPLGEPWRPYRSIATYYLWRANAPSVK